jgi:hypothetical protein
MAPLLYIGDVKKHLNSGHGCGTGRTDAPQQHTNGLQSCRDVGNCQSKTLQCVQGLYLAEREISRQLDKCFEQKSSPAQSRLRLGHSNLFVSFSTLSQLRGLHIYRLYSRRSASSHCAMGTYLSSTAYIYIYIAMIAAVDGITKSFAILSDSDNTQVAVTIRNKKAFMNIDSSSTSMASLRPVLRPPVSKTIHAGIGLCVSPYTECKRKHIRCVYPTTACTGCLDACRDPKFCRVIQGPRQLCFVLLLLRSRRLGGLTQDF